MNELCTIFSTAQDGDHVLLKKRKVYHVYPEDSFDLQGFYCTNTAKQDENPDGQRYTALYLQNKKNVVIDGNGATLMVHGKMTPLLFSHCENIILRNLTIDYACPTMTEFKVLKNQNGVVTIRIHPDCLFQVEGNTLYWVGENDFLGEPYWKDAAHDAFGKGGYRYAKGFLADRTSFSFDCAKLRFTHIEQLAAHTLSCTLADPAAKLPVGTVIQTRNVIRDQVGGMFERCKNLYFEQLRVRFMHGLGMVSQFCDTVAFRNCDFTPKKDRTIASTADFFQFCGCRGQLIVEDCKAWGAQDDFVNVHGVHLRIEEADAAQKTLLLRFSHDESWGYQAFDKGDELEFIRWDTLIPYGKTTVTAFERLNDTDILLHVTEVPAGIILQKDVVENATWTPDVIIRNCAFGPNSCRGILCTTRGKVLIENNRFDTLMGPALEVADDCNFWFESGYTRDIVFRNNEVIRCNYGVMRIMAPAIAVVPVVMDKESRTPVHGRLEVTGNCFSQPAEGNHVIWLEHLSEALVRDNTFDAPFKIVYKACGPIYEENNHVSTAE